MAVVTFGLTSDEFYALTPRQFHLLMDQHRERVEHQELLTGLLGAAVVNWSMHAPETPIKPSAFMPSKMAMKKPPRERINRKKIDHDVRAFMSAQMEMRNKVPAHG